MSNIKILVACHEDRFVPKSEILVPVQVGAALTEERFEGMIADNTGDNISAKNKSYCELTAHYWAWKNLDADYYGLFHYRRYLSFNRVHNDTKGIYLLEYPSLSGETIDDIGLKEEIIHNLVENFDIVVPVELEFNNQWKNGWDQYEKSPHLHVEDMYKAVDVLSELYPRFAASAHEYMQRDRGYFCNMFVMKKLYFDEYSTMLFHVLEETEKLIDFSHYSVDEYRVLGHIAERILGIYIYHKKKDANVKIAELRTVKITQNTADKIKPMFLSNNIAVAISCSNYFMPYCAVLLQSLAENASDKYNYDITILCNNLSIINQEKLRIVIQKKSNIALRFFDVRNMIAGYKFSLKQEHVSSETWYRLLLPEIMDGYKKVLYLDGDIIINSDIAELYQTDLNNYLVAAARDLAVIGIYNYDLGNARKYIDEQLNLSNPYDYFQAGVVLFNLEKMREQYNTKDLLALAESQVWEWGDQDLLNKIADGQVLFLDQAWNVEHDRKRTRITEFRRGPAKLFYRYMKARENPKIIHYAGPEKPWLFPECDMAEYFWMYARKCHTYEVILSRLMTEKDKYIEKKVAQDKTNKVAPPKKKLNWREKAKLYSLPLLPKGTKRRNFVKKIYMFIFCPQGWTVRSDIGMHVRILWRAMLNAFHLNRFHSELRYYESIKNRHAGERCFITCTGPSLRIADLERLKNEYTIGVNSIVMAYAKTEWRPTYYAMVDIYNLGDFLKTHPVVGGKYALKDAFFHYRTKLKTEVGSEKYCLINYSNHWNRRLKKREYKLSANPGVCIYDCFTVTNMAIQLAVFMGFKEIYIIGADCNYDPKQMHFIETEIDNKFRGAKWLPGAVELSIQGYRSAKKFAEKHGAKVFNATRGGMLEVFERVDFDSIDFK